MRPWTRAALGVAAGAGVLYAAVAADVVLRARSAYLEGEKYMRWRERPEEKRAHFQSRFEDARRALERDLERGRITREDFQERLELASFERDELTSESSIKYAYVWFQTAAELFTPPESRWVLRSRERMVEAKRLWQDELRAKGIPFEETMFE